MKNEKEHWLVTPWLLLSVNNVQSTGNRQHNLNLIVQKDKKGLADRMAELKGWF